MRLAHVTRLHAFVLASSLSLAFVTFAASDVYAQRGASTAATEDKKKAARAAYEEGARAFSKGDYRRSAESFEQAYKLSPHHSPLWNAANAWLKAGEDVKGANLLERYLNEAPADAPDRDRATVAIRDLDKRLGRIEVVANEVNDVKVDGAPLSGTRLWVVPGEHVATGEVDGKPIRKVVSVAAGDRVSVTLELVLREETPAAAAAAPEKPRKPLPPWVFIVGAGATVVGGGLTIASGLDARDKAAAFEARRTSATLLSDARSAQDRTNLALGITAGVGVLTLISYFFVDWEGDTKPARAGAFSHPLDLSF